MKTLYYGKYNLNQYLFKIMDFKNYNLWRQNPLIDDFAIKILDYE